MQRQGRAHHLVVPRVLVFLERGGRWLFLRGGPSKWFAGRLNALGGGVEPGEDAQAAARRETVEECGLEPSDLRLAGTVHVEAEPVVLLLVFRGRLPAGDVRPSGEGDLVWVEADDIAAGRLPFLPDVAGLFDAVRAAGDGPPFHRTSRP